MSPTITIPGSLVAVMDELVAVGEQLNAQLAAEYQLASVNRWQPLSPPDLPGLWHWMDTPSPPPDQRDLNRLRDTINISAYIGMRHSDQAEDMAGVEVYADAYRALIDPLLMRPDHPRPLNGTATWARRTGMRLASVDFNGVPVLAVVFPLELQLDRPLIRA